MATRYISPTGNDTTGSGTSVSPWQTLLKAYNSSSNGDTIVCAAGTYTHSGFAFDKSLTVIGAGVLSTVFDANLTGDGRLYANAVSVSTVVFQDLGFKRVLGPSASVFYTASGNWTFRRVSFVDCQIAGGTVIENSSYYSASPSITIDSCIFAGCSDSSSSGTGYMFLTGDVNGVIPDVWSIRNCVFSLEASGGAQVPKIFLKRWGSGPPGTTTLDFRNNTISASGTALTQNLVAYFGSGLVVTAGNNCWHNVTPYSGSGDVVADPLFWDRTARDFRPRPASPIYGAGVLV